MLIGEEQELKVVKKGQIILIVSDLVHMDETLYPEPFTWKPERFLPENDGVLVRGDKAWKTFVPWGGGQHMCAGRFFAMNEMVMQLTLILWYFEIELVDELPEAYIKERFGMGVAHPVTAMRTNITRRRKSQLV